MPKSPRIHSHNTPASPTTVAPNATSAPIDPHASASITDTASGELSRREAAQVQQPKLSEAERTARAFGICSKPGVFHFRRYIKPHISTQEIQEMEALVKEGIDLKQTTPFGSTLLDIAASRNYPEVVQLLLKHTNADGQLYDFGVANWLAWLNKHTYCIAEAILPTLVETGRLKQEQLNTMLNEAPESGQIPDYRWIRYQRQLRTVDYWKTLEARIEATADPKMQRALRFFVDYKNSANESAHLLWQAFSSELLAMAKDAKQTSSIIPILENLVYYFEASGDADMQAFLNRLNYDFEQIIFYLDCQRYYQGVLNKRLNEAQKTSEVNTARILKTTKGVAYTLKNQFRIQYSDTEFKASRETWIAVAEKLQPLLAPKSTQKAYVASFEAFWERVVSFEDPSALDNIHNNRWYHQRLMLLAKQLNDTQAEMSIPQNLEHLRDIAQAITDAPKVRCRSRVIEVLERIELEQALYQNRHHKELFFELSLMRVKRNWIMQYVLSQRETRRANGRYDAEDVLLNTLTYTGILGLGNLESQRAGALSGKLHDLDIILAHIWRQDEQGQWDYLSKDAIADGLLLNPSVRAVYLELLSKNDPAAASLNVQFEDALKELRSSLQADYRGDSWTHDQFEACIHKIITLLKIDDTKAQEQLRQLAKQLADEHTRYRAIDALDRQLRGYLEVAQRPIEAALKALLLADLKAHGYIGQQDAFDADSQAPDELDFGWITAGCDLPKKLRKAEL